MMSTEAELQNIVMLDASAKGITLWRNNVGVGYLGKAERIAGERLVILQSGDVVIRQARRVRYGLHNGSSDLIGLQSMRILPQHVGDTIARFVAIELKSKGGRATAQQRNFIDFINKAGGYAIIARSPADIRPEIGSPADIRPEIGGKKSPCGRHGLE